MKILIVDDSGLMRRVIAKVAASLGFEAIEAVNGADGLAMLRKFVHGIALIILDWNMPVMDGFDVLTKIRSQQEYNHIKVLMATADGIEDDVIKVLKAGANGYLVKPYTEDDLSERILELIPEQKRSSHEAAE